MKILPVVLLGIAGIGLAAVSDAEDAPLTNPQPPVPAVAAGASVWDYAGFAGDSRVLPVDESNEVIRQYCLQCHNDRRPVGGLSLTNFDVGQAHQEGSVEVAEAVIRKLRTGMMPPAGVRRPEGSELEGLFLSLEQRIDSAAALNPNPGSRTFQRLNQAEYARSIRDLLGLQIDAGAFLPPDTKSANFDNIADVQLLSPTLLDAYLNAASEVVRMALGDPHAVPSETTYNVPRLASQLEHVEGAPYGTRGGVSVVHVFPADAEYTFRVELHATPTGQMFGRTAPNEMIEISVDGERVALLQIDRWMTQADPTGLTMITPPIPVRSGARRLSAAFLPRIEGPFEDVIAPIGHSLADTQIGMAYGVTTFPHLRDLVVGGPFNVTGVSDSPTRRQVFTCRPTVASEATACAEGIIGRLATRAYRRPLRANDLRPLMAFYSQGAEEGGFEEGIRRSLQAMLASPHFLFRIEETAAAPSAGGNYRIADLDLASRLSFFLWGRLPDQELVTVAHEGRLSEPAELEKQVRRMLADPRAEAMGTRFAAQWLRLQDLDKVHPDALQFPDFHKQLAADMLRETELFFYGLVREDRSALELINADYSYVNESLARHYGIPGVVGPDFRPVQYADASRRGLLGHGSILTLTSHANRTSPVLRGKWVMEVLLGSPPPAPPPDVPELEASGDHQDGRSLTVREQMERHRDNPSCNSCHSTIDPLGLALENFDVTGRWRIRDSGQTVDPRGDLYDGTPLDGPADLRQALLQRPEPILRTFTENLMAYALGRRLDYYDMPTVRAITRTAAEQDYRMSAFILGVVNSPAFGMKSASSVSDGPIQGN